MEPDDAPTKRISAKLVVALVGAVLYVILGLTVLGLTWVPLVRIGVVLFGIGFLLSLAYRKRKAERVAERKAAIARGEVPRPWWSPWG